MEMQMKGEMICGCVAGMLLLAAGCARGPYVDSGTYNPVSKEAYTRAETIPAGQRLVNAMLADPVFAQHYAAKVQQRGSVPVVQVAYIINDTDSHPANRALTMLKEDLEEALRASGRFVLSGDPDACDYILKGVYYPAPEGTRVTHRLTMRMHAIRNDTDVWTGSEEIAKQ